MPLAFKYFLKKLEKYFPKTAYLVTLPSNITYLTSLENIPGWLLISEKRNIFVISPLYENQAKNISMENTSVKISHQPFKEIIYHQLKRFKINNLYIDNGLKAKEFNFFYNYLNSQGITIKIDDEIITNLRAKKFSYEIKNIKKATELTKQAFEYAQQLDWSNFTEKDLAIELERFLKINGDFRVAFPPIVAFNQNTAYPHHYPNLFKPLKLQLITIDIGAKYKSYCADLTRTFILGKMPLSIKKIYDIVKKAQEKAIKNIKIGIEINKIDLIAREYIHQKGFGKYFCHSLGHGLGLEVHEEPYINKNNTKRIEEGMVFTIEPGIYIPGKFGVRIEDLVWIKNNKVEVLSGDIHR